MKLCIASVGVVALICLNGCMSAAQHRADVQDNSTDRMTVGIVQREIKVGMSGSEVAEVLGAPNIVSTDEERREVWIYDKIATDVVYSNSSGSASLLIGNGGDSVQGGANGSRSAGAASTSQRTLTVVIKFDADKKVRDFAYHTSQF